MAHVMCHLSFVRCYVSGVKCIFFDKVMKLVGGVSVINGPTPSSFNNCSISRKLEESTLDFTYNIMMADSHWLLYTSLISKHNLTIMAT